MIPKKIHYCWYGKGPMPLLARRCLASWQYHLPDYEFKLWDETNFDPARHPFTEAAYAAGKYAFVSDYVRMWALFHEGGIYLDVDVEAYQSLNPLTHLDFFIGLADSKRFATSVIGAKAGHWLSREMLSYYDATAFDITKLSELVNVNQVSRLLLQHGFSGRDADELVDNQKVFAIGTFADAKGMKKHIKPMARHLYAGSWKSRDHKSSLSNLFRLIKQSPQIATSIVKIQLYKLRSTLFNGHRQ